MAACVGLGADVPTFEALKDISFDVPKGRFVGILGKNERESRHCSASSAALIQPIEAGWRSTAHFRQSMS